MVAVTALMQLATAEATAARSFVLLVPPPAVMVPPEAVTPKPKLPLQVALVILIAFAVTWVMLTELLLPELLMARVALARTVPVLGAVTARA